MSLDLDAVAERYHKALNAKPSKGDYDAKGMAAITDSVADVPELLALVNELGGADNASIRADRDHWVQRYEDMRDEAQRLVAVIDRRNAERAQLRQDIRRALEGHQ